MVIFISGPLVMSDRNFKQFRWNIVTYPSNGANICQTAGVSMSPCTSAM